MVNDPHGLIGLDLAAAVQNALRGIPLRPGHNRFMMIGLEILVLLAAILLGLVILEIRRPGLTRQDIATIAFVAQGGDDGRRGPFIVGRLLAALSAACPTMQVIKRCGDFGGGVTVEKHVVHPTDDNADGFSELNVDVHPGLMAPIFTDLDTGYVYGNTWTLGGSTVNYSDVYAVEAGKRYLIGLDDTVGTRFRVLVSEQSTIEATETLPGTLINNVSNPALFASFLFTSSIDGYLTITKDNNGMANIKTYVYDYEALLNGTNPD